jgi:hypothetical protein
VARATWQLPGWQPGASLPTTLSAGLAVTRDHFEISGAEKFLALFGIGNAIFCLEKIVTSVGFSAVGFVACDTVTIRQILAVCDM